MVQRSRFNGKAISSTSAGRAASAVRKAGNVQRQSGDVERAAETVAKVRALREIAARRGQTLPAMALAWTLRDARMTSTLVGVSSVEQLDANLRALERLDFGEDELSEIDRYATESDINIWESSSEA